MRFRRYLLQDCSLPRLIVALRTEWRCVSVDWLRAGIMELVVRRLARRCRGAGVDHWPWPHCEHRVLSRLRLPNRLHTRLAGRDPATDRTSISQPPSGGQESICREAPASFLEPAECNDSEPRQIVAVLFVASARSLQLSRLPCANRRFSPNQPIPAFRLLR